MSTWSCANVSRDKFHSDLALTTVEPWYLTSKAITPQEMAVVKCCATSANERPDEPAPWWKTYTGAVGVAGGE